MTLRSLSRRLKYDYYVATADSVARAEELLAGPAPFSVVITDIRMPGADGLSLIERCGPQHPNTRFIVLTGCRDLATRNRVEASPHVYRFLNKPAGAEELESVLAEAWQSLKLQHRIGNLAEAAEAVEAV